MSFSRDSVIPAYKQLSGFKSALLLIDPTTGKSLGISMWESEADRAAVQTSGALQQQLAKFAAILDVKVSCLPRPAAKPRREAAILRRLALKVLMILA